MNICVSPPQNIYREISTTNTSSTTSSTKEGEKEATLLLL
jgi:hypothetical protein